MGRAAADFFLPNSLRPDRLGGRRRLRCSVEREIQTAKNLIKTQKRMLLDARIGQGEFRKSLLCEWRGCAVTGCALPQLLRTSHIKAWKLTNNRDRLDRDRTGPPWGINERRIEPSMTSCNFAGWPHTISMVSTAAMHTPLPQRVKRCGASQVRRRSLSAVDPIATTLLQCRE